MAGISQTQCTAAEEVCAQAWQHGQGVVPHLRHREEGGHDVTDMEVNARQGQVRPLEWPHAGRLQRLQGQQVAQGALKGAGGIDIQAQRLHCMSADPGCPPKTVMGMVQRDGCASWK